MIMGHNRGVASLELKLALETNTVKAGERTNAEVLLTNRGEAPLIVNSRFSMGYPDTPDRDLYCEISRKNGEKYLGYQEFQVDYRSQDLSPKFFHSLKPGETLRTAFDLQKWYRIKEAGNYLVTVVYEPQPYPDISDAVSGSVTSPPAAITVQ